MTTGGLTLDNHQIVLVLSGGNALGAYQAGAYQALHDRSVLPEWVIGASTGAINGAIICGNGQADRLARLADYWGLGTAPAGPAPVPWWNGIGEDLRRSTAAIAALALGQQHIFAPRLQLGPIGDAFGLNERSSLYDTQPLDATLGRLVDFDRLNSNAPRFTGTAVDLESGEQVVFDTTKQKVGSDHIRASSALLPAFPPVEVGGRLLGDGGLAANLPLDVVLSEASDRPVLCIAVDLLPLRASRPRTVGEAASRMQDLIFASQSARTITVWQARYAERAAGSTAASVTLLHISYDRQEAEVAGKMFDYSLPSVRSRWNAGYTDLTAALGRIEVAELELGRPGLTIWQPPTKT